MRSAKHMEDMKLLNGMMRDCRDFARRYCTS